MRIGIFSDTYPPFINGVSTSVTVLKKYLEKQGHEVFVVTINNEKFRYKYEDDGKIIKVPGIAVGIYDYRLSFIYPLKIIKRIKNWDLDIIHSQTEFGIGTFSRIIAKQLNIPVVHTCHTVYEDYMQAVTKGGFRFAGKKLAKHLTNFYCDRTVTELIVPTVKTYTLFKDKYKYNRNIHIVPNGIDLEKYYKKNCDQEKVALIKKKLGIKSSDFVILYVGRLGKEKNVDFLLNVELKILKKFPNCKMVFVGDGPELARLQKEVKRNKVSDKILFTGKVPLEEVGNYYQIASVFSTASFLETQGLTVIEALAGSIPVLCIKDPSFTPIVMPGLNGDFFTNEKEYISYIENYIKKPSVLIRYKLTAPHSVMTSSGDIFAKKALKVYETALNKKKKRKWFFFRRKNC